MPHGEWLAKIKSDLPFTATMAQGLMKIAADPKIANAARAHLLPPAWGTLYEFEQVASGNFAKAAVSGAIHPKMTPSPAPCRRRIAVANFYLSYVTARLDSTARFDWPASSRRITYHLPRRLRFRLRFCGLGISAFK
jgi:hypothetical protein